MQLLADLNDYGLEVKLEGGIVWVIIMRLPGPHALAVKKSDDAPCQVHLIDVTKVAKILTPEAKPGG